MARSRRVGRRRIQRRSGFRPGVRSQKWACKPGVRFWWRADSTPVARRSALANSRRGIPRGRNRGHPPCHNQASLSLLWTLKLISLVDTTSRTRQRPPPTSFRFSRHTVFSTRTLGRGLAPDHDEGHFFLPDGDAKLRVSSSPRASRKG